MSKHYYNMPEDYYNMSKDLIKSGNLKELKILYKNGILTREVVEKQNYNFALLYACEYGHLNVCKWLYGTFQITKKEASIYDNLAFQNACENGHLEVCQWLYETFQITKEEIMLNYNYSFCYACCNEHYHIISFLCNTFCITEDDVKNIIKEYPKEEQKKIIKYFIPFGSFTKPAK
jgi:hypothetical protein